MLKMYTINSKATIKITNQRAMPTEERKWNHEKIQLIQKKAEKEAKENTDHREQIEIKQKEVKFKPNRINNHTKCKCSQYPN